MKRPSLMDFNAIAVALIGLALAFTQMAHCQEVPIPYVPTMTHIHAPSVYIYGSSDEVKDVNQVEPELVTSPQAFQDFMNQALPSAAASKSMKTQPFAPSLNREFKLGFAANVALRAGDAAQTCLALHDAGREYWMPSQNCAVDAGLILLGIPAQYVAVRLAERMGHPKLARAILWAFPAGSAAAIASSSYHWNDPLPRRKP
jgi:hypothetical protein